MGKTRTFTGAGLAVPCDVVDYVYHLVPSSCGKILRTKKRPYGTGFWKYTIYMQHCRVYMYLRWLHASGVCLLSILAWREVENAEPEPGDNGAKGDSEALPQ